VADADLALVEVGRIRMIGAAACTVVYRDGRGFFAGVMTTPAELEAAIRHWLPNATVRRRPATLLGW
jgi:hypothetical protein